jgi:hypothetical protein
MPTLEINGQEVEIDDSFLSMTPEQQDATVNEIAQSLGGAPAADRGHSNVPEFDPGVKGYNPKTGMVEAQDPGAFGTAMMAGAEGVPIIGSALDSAALNMAAAGGSLLFGDKFARVKREMREMRDKGRAEHPIARLGGNVAGAIATLGPIAGTRTGGLALGVRGPNLATRTLSAGGSNAALAGADTLARGGDFDDAKRSALFGGGLGAALPIVGNKLSQMGSKAAVAAAPTIDDLGVTARAAFDTVRKSGIAVKPPAFDRSLYKMAAQLKSFGFDPDLQKGTATVLNRLSQARGQPLDLQELHNLRKLAGQAARGSEASDREAATIVIDAIDNIVDDAANFTMRQTNAIGAPGATVIGQEGRTALQTGIKTWHTMRKSETVQELFRRAEITAGSNKGPAYAKALRQEFKSLAKRKNGLRGFSPAEKRVIEQVAKGADSRQLTAAFGRFLRSIPATGIGGVSGFALGGGPVGAGAAIAGLSAAGHGIEQAALRSGARAGINAAERAAAFVRSGGQTGGRNYAPNVATPLERSLRPAPLLSHDWGRQ